ncbi:MAG TPA: FtsX-like permease family protein, partial [Longimicrobiales bacterium]|nr:FtsX-like permease family protein [Longimicrobiales bacterium]
LALLVVAGLTLRTLSNVGEIDPGIDHGHLLASYVSTSSTGVTVPERDLWFRTLAERLTEEPWVRAATISDQAPMSPHGSTAFRMEGVDDPADLVYATVVPGYFETLGMTVLRGRDFTLSDSAGAPGVAMVNEAAVRRFFPGSDGVGRHLWQPGADGAPDRGYEVVGVVSDARIRDFLAEPEAVVYLANAQQGYASGSALTVATTIDPAEAVPRLHAWLRDFESHIAVVNVLPYTDVVRGYTYAQRMNAQMFSALAVLGLVLAAVGIFSVMSLAVTQRTREIGVRIALGARRGDIGTLVARQVVASLALGLVAGMAASVALAGLVRSLLFGVAATDPISIAAAALVFLVAALAAALIPARRAARVDPIRSLRAE